MKRALAVSASVIILSGGGCKCGRSPDTDATDANGEGEPAIAETDSKNDAGSTGTFSAPIAAAHAANGDVLVAALDVPARAIRVVRIASNDAVAAQGTALDDVKWAADADLKLVTGGASGGAAVIWRGLRGGKLGRSMAIVGADLARAGAPIEVSGASCATRDAIWFVDGRRARGRRWNGATTIDVDLPKDQGASLACGTTRAFAFLDGDDGTSFLKLAASDAGHPALPAPLLRESDFADDEQRERSEFTVGDDLGVVRLGGSGGVAYREVKDDVITPLKRAHSKIPRDDDVVAVDASSKAIVVVFTQDASAACPDGAPSTKVSALRIERASGEESTFELSNGICARETGPFFTGATGDAVAVAWVERVPLAGKPKAPIVALAHALVPASGPAETAKRIDVAADALVDAGCDARRCYAAALERTAGTDGMVPGPIKVLRYR